MLFLIYHLEIGDIINIVYALGIFITGAKPIVRFFCGDPEDIQRPEYGFCLLEMINYNMILD